METNATKTTVGTEYITVYADWDELSERLQEVVTQLGIPYFIELKRCDYYSWDMFFLNLPENVSDELSAELSEKLGLNDPEHFTYSNSVDGCMLNHLLEKLTNRKVDSSHADEYGVWIICKKGDSSELAPVKSDREEKLQFIRTFIEQSLSEREIDSRWLLSLWTAYCLHYNLDVDTNEYDSDLLVLWSELEGDSPWEDFDEFALFMCQYLV